MLGSARSPTNTLIKHRLNGKIVKPKRRRREVNYKINGATSTDVAEISI
jgi:hypothetical protein